MTYNYDLKNNNPFSKVTDNFTIPSYTFEPKRNTVPIKVSQPLREDIYTARKPQIIQPANKEGKDGKKPLGKIVLGSMLAVGAVALLLTRGFSGATAWKIRRFADKIENKFIRSASKNRAAAHMDEIIVNGSQRIKKLFSLSDAIANFTAVKDTAFHKITSSRFLNINKKWGLQGICDFLTRNILKITESAVDNKYKKVGNALEMFEAKILNALESSKASAAKRQIITEKLSKMGALYREGFNKSARNIRLRNINSGLADLDKKVGEALTAPFKKGSKTKFKDVYSSYVTMKKAAPTRTAHINAINAAKMKVSNNIDDVGERLRTLSNDLKHCLNTKDKNCRLMIGDLLEKIEQYKGLSGSKEFRQRQKLQKDIILTIDSIRNKMSGFSYANKKGQIVKYSSEETLRATDIINSIKDTLSHSSKKGQLQQIITEMKKVLPAKEYSALKEEANMINTLLNNATEIEKGNMFSKIAESKVGSIPTDILALGTTAATGIWAVSKGKNKEERVGATLKVGIPLLGSIGTYLYSGAKAYSGTANLLFSAATVFVLNRIGDAIFKYYQKRYVDKKSVKEIAKEAYSKATNV